MDRGRYAELVRNHFDPDVTLGPLIGAISAGSDAFRAVSAAFHSADGWADPLCLRNVRGPASVPSLTGAVACLWKNPNLFDRTDEIDDLEATAVAGLATVVYPGVEDVGGAFVPGGTHANLYGAKLGLEKLLPGAMRDGLGGRPVVGVASEACHFSNRTAAGWLGLGSRNLRLVPADRALAVRIDALADALDHLYRSGHAVAYVVATVGTTDGFGCDDVPAVRNAIDAVAATHRVPAPHLHADAAVGWPLGFFYGYDLERNPLGLTTALSSIVRRAMAVARGLRHADSVTVDFHKMGYGHYPSSAFLVRRRDDLRVLARSADESPYAETPGAGTLETSRPGLGPFIVAASLAAIDRETWQFLVARALELADTLKRRLATLPRCVVLNPDAPGPNVVFWVTARHRDAAETFRRLDRGELSAADAAECFGEIRRLFEWRDRHRDPARDARLGFTTDYGFRPGGCQVPAWKAVFFHPRTDEAVIDRLVESISALP